jgi:hypothetical protein
VAPACPAVPSRCYLTQGELYRLGRSQQRSASSSFWCWAPLAAAGRPLKGERLIPEYDPVGGWAGSPSSDQSPIADPRARVLEASVGAFPWGIQPFAREVFEKRKIDNEWLTTLPAR